jgi:glycolate oxidase iron-sulfur subunit
MAAKGRFSPLGLGPGEGVKAARRLRADKIAALTASGPDAICTANIGCWLHLAAKSPVPVRHWIEAVDEVI